MITEINYLNRDNVISMQLLADDKAAELAAVTRYVLKLQRQKVSIVIDSDIETDVFDGKFGNGVLNITLGGIAIPAGNYSAALVVYDNTNPDGIIWDFFTLTQREN